MSSGVLDFNCHSSAQDYPRMRMILRSRETCFRTCVTIFWKLKEGCIRESKYDYGVRLRPGSFSPDCVPDANFCKCRPPAQEFQLQAESPDFWNLVDHNAQLGTVATGFGFTEGPVWDQKGFSVCERRNTEQNLPRPSQRQERRSNRARRSRWKYLRPSASPDRLCERFARHHRSDSRGKIQDSCRSLRRARNSTVPTM